MGVSIECTVKNGVVVLPPEAKLPEGAVVEVILEVPGRAQDDAFIAAIRKVAKPRPHWPRDYVRNLDGHLYDVAKKA